MRCVDMKERPFERSQRIKQEKKTRMKNRTLRANRNKRDKGQVEL